MIVVSAGEPAKIAPPTLLELSLENVAPLTDSVLPAAEPESIPPPKLLATFPLSTTSPVRLSAPAL